MIPLASVEAVAAADRAAQAAGTPEAKLMGRAGDALAAAARDLLGGVSGRRVVALAGKGHNGGDALEALARLARRGAGVEALVTADLDTLDAEGRRCVAAVLAAGGRVRRFTPDLAARLVARADLLVDGLLGTGAAGAPRGQVAEAIDAAAAAAAPVLAVDIASGVNGATGEVAAAAVRASATVTFQAAKPGHVLAPGSAHAGRLVVADIGLPLATRWGLTEAADVRDLVPLPTPGQHKWSRGALLVLGGSEGMAGALRLVGAAARRAGCGIVIMAAPASLVPRVWSGVPEAFTVALPEAGGAITAAAVEALEPWLDRVTAVAVGPGLGRAPAAGKVVRDLVARCEQPVVLDADGLTALGEGAKALAARSAPTLVTPHEGEFARLAPDAHGTRLARAAAAAERWDATVLLKGDHTVIAEPPGSGAEPPGSGVEPPGSGAEPLGTQAEPGGRLAVNPTGVPQLATGGTGDVLTGLIGALLCQGLAPFDAARLGAWLHGRAAALAAERLSPASVAAGDVAESLPDAFGELRRAPGAAGTDR